MNEYGQFHDQNGFDANNSTYHYSYQPSYQDQNPGETEKPPRKKRGAARAVALVLCCALVGGGAGVGGAALYGGLTAQGETPTTIYQNTTNPTQVDIREADGLTPMSLAEIYAAYVDSTVNINVTSVVQQGYYQYEATGAGSGFIISEDGYIVTNYHVIDGAKTIKVTLNNGEQYDAKLVGGEELNDVAVLKIDGVSGLKPVVLGDSDDLVVGETVCTIGNALGSYSFSQTSGTVSATGRTVTMNDGTVMNMIQTDCTINSGNSGGPLFDSYGRVVGITSAKLSNNDGSSDAAIEGIGFAIPLNDVIEIITDYMEFGYVTGRPSMGITVSEITQYTEVFGWPAGAYVREVTDGSCADEAGIMVGDIITKIGDTDITGVNQMITVKNGYKAGETVGITLYRSGQYLTVNLTFDEQVNATQEEEPAQTDPEPQQTSVPVPGYGEGSGDDGFFDPWDFFG